MKRVSSSDHMPLLVIGVLLAVYAAGYLALRLASEESGSWVFLPLNKTRAEGIVLVIYRPLYRTEASLRGKVFLGRADDTLPAGMRGHHYQRLDRVSP